MKTPRLDRLIKQWTAHRPLVAGEVRSFTVLHDDWCRFLAGKGDCNCEPDFVAYPPRPPAPGDIIKLDIVPAPPASHN